MAGHTQRREARPYAASRQIRTRRIMVARIAAVVLFVLGAVLGAWAAVTAPSPDGRTLLAVILIVAAYLVAERHGEVTR